MQFALLFENQCAPATSEMERINFRHAVESAMLADELNFDRFYCVEHHGLEGYAHSSAPEVLLSYIAAKTTRLRVAHGVVCTPFKVNHPVRVAERTATLDVLSGGRLDVGFGRGSSAHEQKTFGVEDAETHGQMLESMQAIVSMWTEEETVWDSPTLSIPPRRIRPKPIQDPHPPMLMACTREDSFEIAGRLGLGALSNAADGPNQSAKKRKIYDAARAARKPGDLIGKFDNNHFGATVFTCVREDAAEARSYGLRGMRYFMEAARRWFAGGENPDPYGWTDEENLAALRKMFEATSGHGAYSKSSYEAEHGPSKVGVGLANRAFNPDDVLDARSSAMGDPAQVIDFVERMADAGVDECYFIVQLGGIPADVSLESVRQIGRHVIPHFKPAPKTYFDVRQAN